MSTTPPYVNFKTGKKAPNLLRVWQVLAIVSTLVALGVTTAFVCFVVMHKSNSNASQLISETDLQIPCPQLPTLFPLPKPTPKRITDFFKKLEITLSSLVETSSSLPAISMNVFYKDHILWSGHYGSKIYKHPEMIPNDNTVYRIGSVSKLFAVLLMYKLYEEGKIDSIDDPLSKYAPNFAMKNPYSRDKITLREIASQMSGLPREAPCIYHCEETNSSEQLALLTNRTVVLPPWKTPSYSNLGYALLGRLLTENLLNQTFESWTITNIIKPLEMKDTGFEITPEVEKNMAFPYLPGGKRMDFMNLGWIAPAGQMYSTIVDLAKLGMLFAQPEKQTLFKPATLREMMTPKNIAPDGMTVWGSPFEMTSKDHFLARGKGGNIDTYSASFVVIPELALGANILINADSYLQGNTSGASLLTLASELNKTLFEIQQSEKFPIDSSPYIGKFEVTQTNPVFPSQNYTFNVTIKPVENILRFDYPLIPKTWIEIRYIGEKLVFQAKRRSSGMTCLIERVGQLASIYFDPPGDEKLSPGFSVPEWITVAKRVQESQENFDEENNEGSFKFKQIFADNFRNAI